MVSFGSSKEFLGMYTLIIARKNLKYTMTTQMVDIFLLSFYLLATYQPFASPLYVFILKIRVLSIIFQFQNEKFMVLQS